MMSKYFSEPQTKSLSNYATKFDLKGVTNIDTSMLTSKTDLVSLKAKVDNLDVDKLKNAHADLSKLNNVVDNEAVKETVYDKFLIKSSV